MTDLERLRDMYLRASENPEFTAAVRQANWTMHMDVQKVIWDEEDDEARLNSEEDEDA
jgi:hypothetical protein